MDSHPPYPNLPQLLHLAFCFSDLQGPAAQLATLASNRLLQGFWPATIKQYQRMWQDFMLFQVAAGLPPCQVDIHVLLSFMEFLNQNGHSKPNIANYMAAVRTLHIIYGLPALPFQDHRIQLYLKALQINAPLKPSSRPSIDISTLQALLAFCDTRPHPLTFKALYLTCFFSFLRLSNILPHSVSTFDGTRHLARGDFLTSGEGAVLLIKWSKTIQDRKSITTIPLPLLGSSPLCPIFALTAMIQQMPAHSNDPLFIIKKLHHIQPLTDSLARKHLKTASQFLHIFPSLTFHAFRRAGASWAFNHGVPLEHIMRH